MSRHVASTDIAIIGMACRVPGAPSYGAMWRLLAEGREGRTTLDDEALRQAGEPEALFADPAYVKAGMFLDGVRLFDPGFFGFSPLDARVLDPQHRQFLECAWEAFEDAGVDPGRQPGTIGVFAGSGQHLYYAQHLLTNETLVDQVGRFLLRHTGNDKDFLATRVSYCFDLRGPSINLQTACSTSLVAVHTAMQSLLNGECDVALAGAVTIELPDRVGYLYRPSEILSPDGHCRPFDASAGGTLFGSGVAIVVLKKAAQAVADGDHIHALIKGSAVNNDGSGKVSYLAPSVDGQADAIAEALAMAEVEPDSVSYVEAHGTGTQLGDPIEVAALSQAYGRDSATAAPCGLGSIKSNIGHLDTAAGTAGLIKLALALQHRTLPPTLHYTALNPAIDPAQTSFRVVDHLRPWTGPSPLRAGLSSLGVGGTNAHLVVEEAPPTAPDGTARDRQLLVLSARSRPSLERARQALAARLDGVEASAPRLADIAYTLATGRRAFKHRASLVAAAPLEAADLLSARESDQVVVGETAEQGRRVAFTFAGGGAQHPGMGKELYAHEPAFRAALDRCLSALTRHTDFDLKPLLFPATAEARQHAAAALERPSRALPALFSMQYAQATLWRAWGIEPHAFIGHSMGENTAACLAGVMELDDALGLVALRGRLFERVAPGAMLSVELDEAALGPWLAPGLDVAAVNAPGLTVISGPAADVRRLQERLEAANIGCQRIRIEVAAHSSMLEPILADFRAYLRSLPLSAPATPFISNVTGRWIEPGEATDPEYWVRHLRQTVRFADGVGQLLRDGPPVLLEVGPGRTLTSLASLHSDKTAHHVVLTSMPRADEEANDLSHMMGALGRLWVNGVDPDWTRFYEGQQRKKQPLPTYSFDHAEYWIDRSTASTGRAGDARGQAGVYEPVWRPAAPRPSFEAPGACVLVLDDDRDRLRSFETALVRAGAAVRLVLASDRCLVEGTGPCELRTGVPDDYLRVLDACRAAGSTPSHVIHALGLGAATGIDAGHHVDAVRRCFDSQFFLAQAIASGDATPVHWLALSHRAWQVGGEAPWSPYGALAVGITNTLPREFPSWLARVVDVENPRLAAESIDKILAEMPQVADATVDEPVVAHRGRQRFVRDWLRQDAPAALPSVLLRPHGVYLVTGGTGGLGLVAAGVLAQAAPATLVLVSRRPWPHRQHWDELIRRGAPEAESLNALLALEQKGARVVLETADIADATSVEAVVSRTRQTCGALHGVIHAAGIVDDAPLIAKDLAHAHLVLAPKVAGTTALARALASASLDFFVLYSSSSAFAGLPGQADYAAANAFLDGFAAWAREQGLPCVAVDWPAWRGTGLAAAISRGAAVRPAPGRPTDHPMLGRCTVDEAGRRAFLTQVSAEDSWMIREHRLKDGPALMPGFGFLEMARAAWFEGRPAGPFELADTSVDYPFIVQDQAPRWLGVELSPASNAFVVVSEDGDGRTEHVRGTVRDASPLAARLDVAAIRQRCARGVQRFDDADHHPFLQFGPRWASLKTVAYGTHEALIDLDLAPEFRADLDAYVLHPALLDMAAAGAQVIIEGHTPTDEVFVPVGLGRLRATAGFPSRCLSHVTYKPGPAGESREVAHFDVRVADADGTVFLEIDHFAMRRLPGTDALRRLPAAGSRAIAPTLERALELGIDPGEGARVLATVLAGVTSAQVAVAPVEPRVLVRELRQAAAPPAPAREVIAFDPDDDPAIAPAETVLTACPAVAAAVVRSFHGDGATRRLVAFFVPDHDHFVTQGEVRRYAREHLPAGQVLTQLIELDELPRNGTGVDRRALHDPSAPVTRIVPPRTTVEKAVARVWQDALGVDAVGLTDNFFDLGGHSLLSARIIVQLDRKFGVRLNQATMALGTLEQIARDIERRTEDSPK